MYKWHLTNFEVYRGTIYKMLKDYKNKYETLRNHEKQLVSELDQAQTKLKQFKTDMTRKEQINKDLKEKIANMMSKSTQSQKEEASLLKFKETIKKLKGEVDKKDKLVDKMQGKLIEASNQILTVKRDKEQLLSSGHVRLLTFTQFACFAPLLLYNLL